MEERLQKIIAQAGLASRRTGEQMIRQGRVRVNGKVIRQLGTKADPERDRVFVDGKLLAAREKNVYLLLNKPVGYVTTLKDPQGRPRVVDLVRGEKARVFPVGRLDLDTEGLLLLTNDGKMSYALTHPSHQVEKVYRALVKGIPADRDLEVLAKGIVLEDGPTAPAHIRMLWAGKDTSLIEIGIHEGRKRQIRRMLAAVGMPVKNLQRVKFGPLRLGRLKKGQFRPLTAREVNQLRKLMDKVLSGA